MHENRWRFHSCLIPYPSDPSRVGSSEGPTESQVWSCDLCGGETDRPGDYRIMRIELNEHLSRSLQRPGRREALRHQCTTSAAAPAASAALRWQRPWSLVLAGQERGAAMVFGAHPPMSPPQSQMDIGQTSGDTELSLTRDSRLERD